MREIFIPTKRTEYFFATIFIIVLFWSFVNFPVSSFLSGDMENAGFKIGWPVAFFELSMTADTGQIPFSIKWLIISCLAYILIAYILDILIGLILLRVKNSLIRTPEEKPKETVSDVYAQAKKAFDYYKNKGMNDDEIVEMFKDRGWKEEDIRKIMQLL
jgi:hypothetical protein